MRRILISDLSNACGRSVAAYFVEQGDYVAGLYPPGEGMPQGVEVFPADATDENAVRALAQELFEAGGVDAIVFTARQMPRMSVEHSPPEQFMDVMRRNTKTAFLLTQHVGGRMAERGRGALVYIGSIHGEKPTGASFGFACSMGALKLLNREAALQLGRKGLHSVLIELGPVAGDEVFLDSTLTPIYDGYLHSIPRKRACTYEELCRLIVCAIDNPLLNGADIRADGAFTLKYFDR